jgi:hypothetical protein
MVVRGKVTLPLVDRELFLTASVLARADIEKVGLIC